MSRGPRTSHRLDANHKAICGVWERRGLLVLSLASLGGGAADLALCNPWTREIRLVEIKTAKGKLRESQLAFQQKGWPVNVVRDEASAELLASVMLDSLVKQEERRHG